jgi:acetylornithine/succinyldiaminopimelate/putrescine aminotransferase
VLEAFETENIIHNVKTREVELRDVLASGIAAGAGGIVREVRGKGLMIGMHIYLIVILQYY